MSPMTKQMGEPSAKPVQPADPETRTQEPNLATNASLVLGALLIGIVVASTLFMG